MNLDIARVDEGVTDPTGNSWMLQNRVSQIPHVGYASRCAVDIFTNDPGLVSDIGRGLKFPTPIAAMDLRMFVMIAKADGDAQASLRPRE
jgi:3-hydroxyisobutyrate dehydrogenase